jgi:hypothetical protein
MSYPLFGQDLYLPEVWVNNLHRRSRAGIPDELVFATNPVLVHHRATVVAGVACAWVTTEIMSWQAAPFSGKPWTSL